MSIRGGVVLSNSSFIGSSAGLVQFWPGGRSSLVINASQYGTGVIFQVQGPAPQANWIAVCSTVVADQVFNFDAPPGQYRIISNAGSSIGLCASLVGTAYT